MRYILLIVWMVFLSGCDPQNNYIDTGISDGKHDCSMYEYFKSDPDNLEFFGTNDSESGAGFFV